MPTLTKPAFVWSALPSLQFPREKPVAVALEDGRLLVVGKTGWIWNSRKGWMRRDDLPPEVLDEARSRWRTATSLVRPDGTLKKVSAMYWDATEGTWTRSKTIPGTPAIENITLHDGTRLTVGGTKLVKGEKFPEALDTVIIQPAKGRTRKVALHSPRIRAALTPLPDGGVLVTGGYRVDVYFYDHEKDKPSEEAELVNPTTGMVVAAGRLVKPRDGHGVAVLPDGSVLLAGGRNELNPSLAEVEIGIPASSRD